MKLKIDNIKEVLLSEGQVVVSKSTLEEDMRPLIDYYKRTIAPDGSRLHKLAEGELDEFAAAYLSHRMFEDYDRVLVSEKNASEVKLILI